MIYAVVRYPKRIKINTDRTEFNIYQKQSSNKEKMMEYCQEIKARYEETCYVHLVSRERAKTMQKMWFAKLLDRDQAYLDAYNAKFN